jgi:hypothetical protein
MSEPALSEDQQRAFEALEPHEDFRDDADIKSCAKGFAVHRKFPEEWWPPNEADQIVSYLATAQPMMDEYP